MSKRSLFWGNASGKLGEAVFYRAGGEQRTRTYVQRIKNPKTLAQMVNRVSMKNMSSFYRAAQELLRHSFSNRKANQSGFNAFVQASKNAQSAAISSSAAARGLSIPVGLAISRGNLALGGAQFVGTGEIIGNSDSSARALVFLRIGSSSAALDAPIIQPASSVSELMQTIESITAGSGFVWNPELVGDLTVGVIISEYDDDGFVPAVRKVRLSIDGVSHAITAVEGDFTLATYDTAIMGVYTATNGDVYLAAAIAENADGGNGCWYGGVFLAKRDANGSLVTSNANMQFIGGSEDYSGQFLPNGEIYDEVLQSLGVGESLLV